ncbi:hypothetical protein ABZ904_38675 [Streptomyces sp. NPDC046900]|uniref:hypothetical protein n=1 Tax=Streptomyces sp. NPDC046900 TaxID=3155473 RepID=UPI0033EF8D09
MDEFLEVADAALGDAQMRFAFLGQAEQDLLDAADVIVVIGSVSIFQHGPPSKEFGELRLGPKQCAGHAGPGEGGAACGDLGGEFLKLGLQDIWVTALGGPEVVWILQVVQGAGSVEESRAVQVEFVGEMVEVVVRLVIPAPDPVAADDEHLNPAGVIRSRISTDHGTCRSNRFPVGVIFPLCTHESRASR